jgi:hypothetical protein
LTLAVPGPGCHRTVTRMPASGSPCPEALAARTRT